VNIPDGLISSFIRGPRMASVTAESSWTVQALQFRVVNHRFTFMRHSRVKLS